MAAPVHIVDNPVIADVSDTDPVSFDENHVVVIDGTAWVISGYVWNATDGTYGRWAYANYLPYLLPYDLTADVWGTPVAIPPPAGAPADAAGANSGSDSAQATGKWGFEGGYYGVIDGKIYFGGGDSNLYDDGSGAADDEGVTPWSERYGRQLMCYDPGTDTFTTLAVKPHWSDFDFFAVADDKLWVGVTRDHDTQVFNVYDPITDTWDTTAVADITATGGWWNDMCAGFQVGRTIVFPDYGLIYNIDTNTYTAAGDRDSGFWDEDSAVARAPDGTFWVIGGWRASADRTNRTIGMRVYDPVADSWDDGGVDSIDISASSAPYRGFYWSLAFMPDGGYRLFGGSRATDVLGGGPPPPPPTVVSGTFASTRQRRVARLALDVPGPRLSYTTGVTTLTGHVIYEA